MPHLHQSPGQHDTTASVYIVRTDGPEPAVLLHMHKKLGMLLQFGGHIELDETPWQGLSREVAEESGYDMSQLKILQPPTRFHQTFEGSAQHPLPFYLNTHAFQRGGDHFHSDLTYAAVTTEAPAHPIASGESDAIRLYTAAELRALDASQIFDAIRASALYVLEHLIYDWAAVPASQWPV